MDMKKTLLLSIAFLVLAGITGHAQMSGEYIDLIAGNHFETYASDLDAAPRDGTVNVSNLDTFVKLKIALDENIAEPRDFKRNTNIGLSNLEVGKMIIIHPNPVIDRFRLKVPAEIGEVTSAGIFNMDGSKVRSFGSKIGNGKDRELEMDANDLLPGLYFLRIENKAGTVTRSFEVREP